MRQPAWSLVADAFGAQPTPEGTWWQTLFTALAGAGVLVFVVGGVFSYGWMPAALRPRWIRELEGLSPITNDDGSPAQLPAWTGARRGQTLARSEGPLLGAEAADLMWRNYTVRVPMGKPGGPSQMLSEFSLIASDGRATPAALLLMHPLRTPLAVVQVVEICPSPDNTRRDLLAYLGKEGHACVAWQEAPWPLDPSQVDNRKITAKLGLTLGPGARRKVNSPYRMRCPTAQSPSRLRTSSVNSRHQAPGGRSPQTAGPPSSCWNFRRVSFGTAEACRWTGTSFPAGLSAWGFPGRETSPRRGAANLWTGRRQRHRRCAGRSSTRGQDTSGRPSQRRTWTRPPCRARW